MKELKILIKCKSKDLLNEIKKVADQSQLLDNNILTTTNYYHK